MHVPAEQWSSVVQSLESLHSVLSGRIVNSQPTPATHVSVVHGLPSLHTTGRVSHAPVVGLQKSSMQGSELLEHCTGTPIHFPAWQLSPVVHLFPSSHAGAVGVAVASGVVVGVTVGAVQIPPVQIPLRHCVLSSHALPSRLPARQLVLSALQCACARNDPVPCRQATFASSLLQALGLPVSP